MKSKMLNLLNIYWAFTLFYYCFGKVYHKIPSYILLLVYCFICYSSLNLGYYSVKRRHKNSDCIDKKYSRHNIFKYNKKMFRFCCIIFIIFQVTWVVVFMGEFNVFNIIDNLGSNYFERLSLKMEATNPAMKLRTLFWFFSYYVYPMGFTFFKDMKKNDRLLFLITISIDVIASLNMGISKNIGDIVIILIATMMLNAHGKNLNIAEKIKNKKKTIYILFSIFTLFFVFTLIQSKRFEAVGKVVTEVTTNAKFGIVRSTSILDILCLGNGMLVYSLHSLFDYFSSSYTALALAFTLPFKNTYGLGFSRALMEYANQYLGISVSNNTYCQQLEEVYGWLNGVSWPTAFVWIANAVTFFGVPIVLYLLGNIWAKAEISWKKERKLISLVVYSQLVIAFVYLPCNMQIVQSRSSLIATTIMFILFAFRNTTFKLKNINIKSQSYKYLIEGDDK